jgi:hypothetical protein
MIRKVTGLYYSPAGAAAVMTERLARQIGAILDECSPLDVSIECHDMLKEDSGSLDLDDETVVVIGMPVYVGKIPLPAAEVLRDIEGAGAMALTAVAYGGRSYGNALFELKRVAEECGFRPVGAGAFMASFMATRGSSRMQAPLLDVEALYDFGKAATEKIKRLNGSEIEELRIRPMPVEVNGKMPVHGISRISPKAAAVAQSIFNKLSVLRRKSEWFL